MTIKRTTLRSTQTASADAIKYIRIVIASYILAVGFGVISGFDASIYFGNFLAYPAALYVAQVFVVFCGLMLLSGYLLRPASLSLTIVILASSAQLNLIAPVQGSLDAFWVDLVVACSLLACYWPLSSRQLRKQGIVRSTPGGFFAKGHSTGKVVPRRVTLPNRSALRSRPTAPFGQGISIVTPPAQKRDVIAERIARLMGEQNAPDEMQNIFA